MLRETSITKTTSRPLRETVVSVLFQLGLADANTARKSDALTMISRMILKAE